MVGIWADVEYRGLMLSLCDLHRRKEGEKMLIDSIKQQRKSQGGKGDGRRLLISINVMGSPGPIRFVVSEDELVGSVIGKALRSYARQGRLPVLESNPGDFLLYCANAEPEALSPWETIGSRGARNFLLWKKQKVEEAHEKSQPLATGRKGSESWKILKALLYQSRKKESGDINQNHKMIH